MLMADWAFGKPGLTKKKRRVLKLLRQQPGVGAGFVDGTIGCGATSVFIGYCGTLKDGVPGTGLSGYMLGGG